MTDHFVWLVETPLGAIAFGSEAGADEARSILESHQTESRKREVRYCYDSAFTEDLLKLSYTVRP